MAADAPQQVPDPSAGEPAVRAWVVRDTGLAPAPSRFRRLPGAIRHHAAEGPEWPSEVALRVEGPELVVDPVGRWPLADVDAEVVQPGPPVVVALRAPGTSQLVAAPADAATADLLDRLGVERR